MGTAYLCHASLEVESFSDANDMGSLNSQKINHDMQFKL